MPSCLIKNKTKIKIFSVAWFKEREGKKEPCDLFMRESKKKEGVWIKKTNRKGNPTTPELDSVYWPSLETIKLSGLDSVQR